MKSISLKELQQHSESFVDLPACNLQRTVKNPNSENSSFYFGFKALTRKARSMSSSQRKNRSSPHIGRCFWLVDPYLRLGGEVEDLSTVATRCSRVSHFHGTATGPVRRRRLLIDEGGTRRRGAGRVGIGVRALEFLRKKSWNLKATRTAIT